MTDPETQRQIAGLMVRQSGLELEVRAVAYAGAKAALEDWEGPLSGPEFMALVDGRLKALLSLDRAALAMAAARRAYDELGGDAAAAGCDLSGPSAGGGADVRAAADSAAVDHAGPSDA